MTNWIRCVSVATMAIAITSALPVPAVAQGIGHGFFMRGQVVAMTADIATVCVGRADGARPGQILKVVRITSMPGPSKSTSPGFRRDDVGTIRIDTIVDEHFARASVVTGHVATYDLVELERK